MTENRRSSSIFLSFFIIESSRIQMKYPYATIRKTQKTHRKGDPHAPPHHPGKPHHPNNRSHRQPREPGPETRRGGLRPDLPGSRLPGNGRSLQEPQPLPPGKRRPHPRLPPQSPVRHPRPRTHLGRGAEEREGTASQNLYRRPGTGPGA